MNLTIWFSLSLILYFYIIFNLINQLLTTYF
ncbi:MAG: hypothetical protein [Microvirus sp.]|nr:MAG: hypothetical protein [Microvirus sp.]